MSFVRSILIATMALSLLTTACAGPGSAVRAEGEATVGSEGIHTSSIRSAPATQETQNYSRPLSELDTPEAVAAREAATPKPAAKPRAATAVPVVAAAAPAAASAFQKGAKIKIRDGAVLYARPSLGSDTAPALNTAPVELGAQIYNVDGYWWYVTAGNESGWLLQTDIAR